MLYISDTQNHKWGITDTLDNTVEFYKSNEIFTVTKLDLTIKGVLENSIDVLNTGIVISYLLDRLECSGSVYQKQVTDTTLNVRDWGDWELPEDVYEHIEDEAELMDYDWEVLSDASKKRLKEILSDVRDKFPQYNISCQGSEKNWLLFEINIK